MPLLADLTARLTTGYTDTSGRHVILVPEIAIWASAITGCPLVHASVLLDKESSGGKNVFGKPKACGPARYSPVTEQTYRQYLANRATCGEQGVGPLQLTSAGIQDGADRAGGCWRPEINVRWGLAHFARLLAGSNPQTAYSLWNTGKALPSTYATDAMSRAQQWQKVIQG